MSSSLPLNTHTLPTSSTLFLVLKRKSFFNNLNFFRWIIKYVDNHDNLNDFIINIDSVENLDELFENISERTGLPVNNSEIKENRFKIFLLRIIRIIN